MTPPSHALPRFSSPGDPAQSKAIALGGQNAAGDTSRRVRALARVGNRRHGDVTKTTDLPLALRSYTPIGRNWLATRNDYAWGCSSPDGVVRSPAPAVPGPRRRTSPVCRQCPFQRRAHWLQSLGAVAVPSGAVAVRSRRHRSIPAPVRPVLPQFIGAVAGLDYDIGRSQLCYERFNCPGTGR
jgi:hypothetical protein